jgi:hypothetical protein
MQASGNRIKSATPHQPVIVEGPRQQHTSTSVSKQRHNSPVNATPRIHESQWRDMGFDSEEKARLTLGDDFFGGPIQVCIPSGRQHVCCCCIRMLGRIVYVVALVSGFRYRTGTEVT